MAKATTIKDAVKKLVETRGINAAESEKIELNGQCPPIEKMDATLSTLKACRHLALSTNNIEKISSLAGMDSLKILSLGRNLIKKVENVEVVAETLEELWLSYNSIEKLSGVEKLANLRVLFLSNNKIRDWVELDRLAGLEKLEDLLLVGNPLFNEHRDSNTTAETGLQVLKRLPGLKKLDGIPVDVDERDQALAARGGAYRVVGALSTVDESLFNGRSSSGAKKAAKAASDQKQPAAKPARKPQPRGGAAARAPQVVSLRQEDVARMRAEAPIMSAEELAALRREVAARREEGMAAAKARKERMMALEEEARSKAPPPESEAVRGEADGRTLARAEALIEEEADEVKLMNRMVRYAQCVTVRDKQIVEKRAAALAEAEEQRRLDAEMEVERLRALEAYQNRDKQRLAEQQRGALTLKGQLAEREAQRVAAEELRDQERAQMLRELERLKEEEARAAADRRARAAALMREVAEANEDQIARKAAAAERDRDEELRVAEYIRQRDAREQAAAAERERAAQEREMEVARLRGLQERLADRQGEVDEMRARRWQEAKDREWRNKERAAAERQAAMVRDLAEARESQMRSKLQLQADVAQLERTEFDRVLGVNKQREAELAAQADAQRRISAAYKRDLQSQVMAANEAKELERRAHLEEGRRLREAAEREKARLEEIKSRKLQDLAAAAVPPKYQAELARLRVTPGGGQ
ncbi:MAG: tumor suppressor, Mitostatin-domain-containing protein [Monoraphidium minutum]|nr:MAG: tumor suppressor, Mitostatin-domain-containing protein [Monoraphidium minutum]